MLRKMTYITTIVCIILSLSGCNKEEKKIEIQSQEDKQVKIQSQEDKQVISKEIIKKEVIDEAKTIVIDPGHSSVGNPDKEQIAPHSSETKAKDVLGATGVYTNIPEHDTTVSISLALEKKLIEKGFNVILTKNEVNKSLSNIDRAQIGNDNNADLVIRIHADSSNDTSVKGASVLIPPDNKYTSDISQVSKNYGEEIINIYTQELDIKNRGTIYRDDMTGFNWSTVPVVILEMGFLSNEKEDNFISSKENHEIIANSIANGVYKCFG